MTSSRSCDLDSLVQGFQTCRPLFVNSAIRALWAFMYTATWGKRYSSAETGKKKKPEQLNTFNKYK